MSNTEILTNFNQLINNIFNLNNKINLLQIGGNDGQQTDFVNKAVNNENIIFHIVEPIPLYFQELKNYYKNNTNVYTYNYAITNTSGHDYINYIPPHENMPIWLKGCSSFFTDRNVLSGFCNWDENGEPYNPYDNLEVMSYIKNNTVKLQVNCLTFNDFIQIHNIQHIDILVIDTEGYDYHIFKQINLDKFNIRLIIIEYDNQTGFAKKDIVNILKQKNYTILYSAKDQDLIAYK